ncbi:hypothetical protein B9Z38_06520 [Limnohabitans sp. MMS-10A-160]|nr:hypothetical protein B9Z43_04195 [Limnohabitans sp. MMS-10A-192]PUE25979.1 hypothetical protein B9Z38_06520 [Limnohabitans sp. MMS-10A-160]
MRLQLSCVPIGSIQTLQCHGMLVIELACIFFVEIDPVAQLGLQTRKITNTCLLSKQFASARQQLKVL